MKKLTALILTGVFLTLVTATPSDAAVRVVKTSAIGGPWCCYQ